MQKKMNSICRVIQNFFLNFGFFSCTDIDNLQWIQRRVTGLIKELANVLWTETTGAQFIQLIQEMIKGLISCSVVNY